MGLRRFLSGLLFGIGCALIFISLLALMMSAIPNQQLKLILDSFSQISPNHVINLLNRGMSFVLQYSWRVLALGVLTAAAGGLLMLRFSPKSSMSKKPAAAVLPPKPAAAPAQEPPNPFAASSYIDHQPAAQHNGKHALTTFHQPILERNRIEETEAAVPEFAAYIPARFTQEKQAIETEAGAPSQSGSRILIRSMQAPANLSAEPAPQAEEKPVSKVSSPAVPEPVTAPLPTASVSPASARIRSTMGRHSKNNLPPAHS